MPVVAWPDPVWIREIGMQVVYPAAGIPGQVVQLHGQVVTTVEPRWEITTAIYGWSSAEMRTFLHGLAGAINPTIIPLVQPAVKASGGAAVTSRPISAVQPVADGRLTLETVTPVTYGVKAGQFWSVGTAAKKRIYEVVQVDQSGGAASTGSVIVVPGSPPESGTNVMVPATGIRARLADPEGVSWGTFDALLRLHRGTSLRWYEA